MTVRARAAVGTFVAVTAGTARRRGRHIDSPGTRVAAGGRRLGDATGTTRLTRTTTIAAAAAGRRGCSRDSLRAVHVGPVGRRRRRRRATGTTGAETPRTVDVTAPSADRVIIGLDVVFAIRGAHTAAGRQTTGAADGPVERAVDITTGAAVHVAVRTRIQRGARSTGRRRSRCA